MQMSTEAIDYLSCGWCLRRQLDGAFRMSQDLPCGRREGPCSIAPREAQGAIEPEVTRNAHHRSADYGPLARPVEAYICSMTPRACAGTDRPSDRG